jgi:hypothetical protein
MGVLNICVCDKDIYIYIYVYVEVVLATYENEVVLPQHEKILLGD